MAMRPDIRRSFNRLSIADLSLVKGVTSKLSIRERNALVVGGLILLVFAVAQFVYFPMADRQQALQRALASEQESLAAMEALSGKYLAMSHALASDRQHLEGRPQNFTLFSFLDTRAELSGVKQNIDYMKPSVQAVENSPYTLSKVQLKLKSLYLAQCIDFLARVESPEAGVRITSLSLSREGRSKEMLTMVIEAQTLVSAEGV